MELGRRAGMSCGRLRPLWMQPPSESEGLVWRSWTAGRGPFQGHKNHTVAKNCNRVRDELEDHGTADGSSVRCMFGLRIGGAVPPLTCVPLWRVQKRCFRRGKEPKAMPSCASTYKHFAVCQLTTKTFMPTGKSVPLRNPTVS
jgi:hypothetical protein